MSSATASMLARCSAVIVDQNPSRLLCSRSSATYSTRFLFKSFTSVRYLCPLRKAFSSKRRSEEHTSELQSRRDLVCRLLLEKKKKKYIIKQMLKNTNDLYTCTTLCSR